jgi:DNA-3-methyladenine glycosylase II
MDLIEFELKPERPYSLARTAARLIRFTQVVDQIDDDDRYSRCLHLAGKPTLLSVVQSGSAARAMLHVTLQGDAVADPAARDGAERFVRRSLGAGCKLRHFYKAFGDDPLLAASIRANRGMSLCGGATLFEAMLTSILAQQVNLIFAYSIYQALTLRYGERMEVDGKGFIAFPTAERIARVRESTLRNFKLSGAKAGAISRIAKGFATGELEEKELDALADEEVIERLVAYKGIGRWTAETSMMRGLCRVDIFPAGDLGVIKKIAVEMLGRTGKATEAEMRAFAERWRPHRSLALIYAYAVLYSMEDK